MELVKGELISPTSLKPKFVGTGLKGSVNSEASAPSHTDSMSSGFGKLLRGIIGRRTVNSSMSWDIVSMEVDANSSTSSLNV